MIAETTIAKELAAIERMTARELRTKYAELFGEESRSRNRQWLLRRCAWRVQAMAEGDLSARARRRAKELARDYDLRLRPPPEKALFPQLDVVAALTGVEKRLDANDANHLLILGTMNRLQESVEQLAGQVQALVAEFQSPVR